MLAPSNPATSSAMRSRISRTSSALENESITRYPGTNQREYELGFPLRYGRSSNTRLRLQGDEQREIEEIGLTDRWARSPLVSKKLSWSAVRLPAGGMAARGGGGKGRGEGLTGTVE